MKKIQASIPNAIHKKIQELIDQGWFRSEKTILAEALRQFVNSHTPELMEKYFRDDMEWGLRGRK